MKKIIGYVIALVIIISCTANCFAYTKVKNLHYSDDLKKYVLDYDDTKVENINEITCDAYKRKYPEELFIGAFWSPYIVSTDFKYINGTAMIKVRDAVSAMGGKIEYNSDTKSTKAYIPIFSSGVNAIKSFSITANKKNVDFTVRDASYELEEHPGVHGSCTFKITPTIIDGSLYVSAIDFGNLICKYYNWGDGQVEDYDYDNDLVKANVLNNILYIKVHSYFPW